MIEGERRCVLVEPRGDAAEFIGTFFFQRWERFNAGEELIAGGWYRWRTKTGQFTFAPRRVQSAMVEGDAAQWTEVDREMSGSAKLIKLSLTADRSCESTRSVANVGGFFKSLFTGKSNDALSDWLEQQVGFGGDAANRSFNNHSILIGINTTSARAH